MELVPTTYDLRLFNYDFLVQNFPLHIFAFYSIKKFPAVSELCSYLCAAVRMSHMLSIRDSVTDVIRLRYG